MKRAIISKKKILIYLLFSSLIIAPLIIFLSTKIVYKLTKDTLSSTPPTSIEEIEIYLSEKENLVKPKSGTEKKIFFNSNNKKKAALSFVYLHGFSASRREISPVFESVAKHWNAPIFMTRFFGHGLTPEKLGAATFNDWIQDSIEAYQIGLTLGEQVVITCASTGCSLAMYLAYFFPDKIHALIMVSPNFSPADSRSFLALGPLGLITTRLLLGKYQEFKPSNNLQAYYWTYKYETSVIPEMINLVAGIKNLDLSRIQTPVLTIYTPFDKVVSTQEIEKNTQRLGSIRNKLVPIFETKEHILAGDIMNPKLNNKIIQLSIQFLKNL